MMPAKKEVNLLEPVSKLKQGMRNQGVIPACPESFFIF
jgi:hypothetical protein